MLLPRDERSEERDEPTTHGSLDGVAPRHPELLRRHTGILLDLDGLRNLSHLWPGQFNHETNMVPSREHRFAGGGDEFEGFAILSCHDHIG